MPSTRQPEMEQAEYLVTNNDHSALKEARWTAMEVVWLQRPRFAAMRHVAEPVLSPAVVTQLSPPSAPKNHGFSSLAVGAEFSPAGAVRPVGGFFFVISSSQGIHVL